MDNCNLKWIFIGLCILITLTGLYLAFLRDYTTIKKGAIEFQDAGGSVKDGSFTFKFAIGLVLILIGIFGGYFSIKSLPGCDQDKPVIPKPNFSDSASRDSITSNIDKPKIQKPIFPDSSKKNKDKSKTETTINGKSGDKKIIVPDITGKWYDTLYHCQESWDIEYTEKNTVFSVTLTKPGDPPPTSTATYENGKFTANMTIKENGERAVLQYTWVFIGANPNYINSEFVAISSTIPRIPKGTKQKDQLLRKCKY